MEFTFNVHKALQQELVISCWDASTLNDPKRPAEWRQQMAQIIDSLGRLSGQAQGLSSAITSISRMAGTDQRAYLYADENKAIGLLKVGHKKLFIRNAIGQVREIEPLCCLDFYVHESYQRGGIGKALFEVMLSNEGLSPHNMAYDRPSPKLLSFLRKHYGLSNFVPQNNNFVVFNSYFGADTAPPVKLGSSIASRPLTQESVRRRNLSQSRSGSGGEPQYTNPNPLKSSGGAAADAPRSRGSSKTRGFVSVPPYATNA